MGPPPPQEGHLLHPQPGDPLLLPQRDAPLLHRPALAHLLLQLPKASPEDCPSPPLPHLPLLLLLLPDLLPPYQQWCQLYKQCLQCQASQWQQVSLLLLAYLSSCRCQLCPLFFLRISSAYSPQLTSSV